MKTTLVWSSPRPELTVAIAMRRCYSTKPIEDIVTELEQKGPEYWRYLLTKAMQDKSLDVLEHFTLTLVLEGIEESAVGSLAVKFPHLRASRLDGKGWLASLNARTLVELWRDPEWRPLAESIVAELDSKNVCPIFNSVAFGEAVRAR